MMTPPPTRPLAYSYVRFSTPEQAKGNSFRRQLEAAEDYARRNNLELSLEEFSDLGVSAWQGANVAVGKLGAFLVAVHKGDVPQGSFLLVESLDRVSRSNVWDAFSVLQSIITAGISVVTLSDDKVYSRETMRDPMALIMSLLVFARANDESEMKSKRVRDAWQKKKDRARAELVPMTRMLPGWLRLSEDGQHIEPIADRVAVVREIVREATAGVGLAKIAANLNARGVETWGKGKGEKRAAFWHKSYVSKIIRSRALIGEFAPTVSQVVDGRRVFAPLPVIPDYYPPVLSVEEFELLCQRTLPGHRQPPMRAATGQVSNALAGLAKCPLCGSTMTRVNKGSKGGSPYLVCVKAKAGSGCEYRMVRVPHVEEALRRHASYLCGTAPGRDDDLEDEWQRLEREIAGHQHVLSNLLDAIKTGEGGGTPSALLVKEFSTVEQAMEALRVEQRRVAADLNRTGGRTLGRLLGELEDVLASEASTASQINAALRPLFRTVRVNYLDGQLEFQWHHSPQETAITFAWPREAVPDKAAAE